MRKLACEDITTQTNDNHKINPDTAAELPDFTEFRAGPRLPFDPVIAEQVVRANLQTAATVHGAEHRFTLGTRMNLGLLLGSLGKPRESEAEFKALLAVQRRAADHAFFSAACPVDRCAACCLQRKQEASRFFGSPHNTYHRI